MCATNIPGNERSLVIRPIAGDEDAFCELYAAYKNRLDIFCDAFSQITRIRRGYL